MCDVEFLLDVGTTQKSLLSITSFELCRKFRQCDKAKTMHKRQRQ
jgi:hypothetical protein